MHIYILCTNILHTGHTSCWWWWLCYNSCCNHGVRRLSQYLSYFVVFCCADFCFPLCYTVYTVFCLYITADTHKALVCFVLRDLLVLLFGDPILSFCTVILVASLSTFVVVFFILYSVLNVFILMHVDFVYLYSNTFVNSLKRTMSLGRLSRKRNREINVDSQSELSEQKSSVWVACFCLLGCTNGLAFQV